MKLETYVKMMMSDEECREIINAIDILEKVADIYRKSEMESLKYLVDDLNDGASALYNVLEGRVIKKSERTNVFKIKTPDGYFIVEEKGSEDNYPGVFIYFTEDGIKDGESLVTCVEYDTEMKSIRSECYKENGGYPVCIIDYESGKDVV